jgi:NADPH:quinone reductase-like Zn-dependent oxidoreductase
MLILLLILFLILFLVSILIPTLSSSRQHTMTSPPSYQATMSAYTHTLPGHPSTILSPTQIPKPDLKSPSQILIRISHCALNPGASIVMHLLPFFFRATPAIPEMDFAGVVEDIYESSDSDEDQEDGNGDGNGDLKRGMQVFGSIPLSQHVKTSSGALAQYVVLDSSFVCRTPPQAKPEEVAGLGIAGATALELVRHAGLKQGDSVLINGASGGIGHLVLQMCRVEVGETGRVVAVCSKNNVGWVKELGCDEVRKTHHMRLILRVLADVNRSSIILHMPQYTSI